MVLYFYSPLGDLFSNYAKIYDFDNPIIYFSASMQISKYIEDVNI